MTPQDPDPHRRSEGSMPDEDSIGSSTRKMNEDARDAKREVSAEAREQAMAGQHRLAHEADALSDAIDAAASNLDDQDREGLARYARELSSNLATAAGQIEGRSVDELANDAKRLARNNPALFMLGSIAVGFGLSRFFKASTTHEQHEQHEHDNHTTPHEDTNGYSNNDIFRDDDVLAAPPVPRHERHTTATHMTSTAPRSGNGSEMP